MSESTQDRVFEVKGKLELVKQRIQETHLKLTAKIFLDVRGRPIVGMERQVMINNLKATLTRLLGEQREVKNELRRLSGTTGHDQKWLLIARAYRLLVALDERGVEIGEEGEKLLDEISFHVPASRLIGEEERKVGT